MLTISQIYLDEMIAHAIREYPLEACGLISGRGDQVKGFYKTRNDAASARIYTVNPLDHLRADRDAEANGNSIIGVMHSHTHSDAYPSPTDVAQAPDPGWHYVLVSLKYKDPVLRSFCIVNGNIEEESVVRLNC
ncbi:MAG: M67 family metallopeptidase [Acidimicrobiaceae bacterium]|nr:M67 family metallopeptidase [Acidimicrobiaceae bacterium]